MQKILVVEDDLDIQELLKNFLQEAGYSIVLANDGVEALSIFSDIQFDLILLDIMLPKIDGFAVCELIRKQSQVPIIMLTALNGEEEQIRGLDMQVDDYITKPFGVMELLSRIKAVLRRTAKQSGESEVFEIDGWSLDASRRIVTYNGIEVTLTYKEFELLMYLMRHQSIAVTRDKLMEMVWGYEFAGETRTVDMHIKTLRQKLEAAGCRDIIKTVRGVGYKCG